MNDNLFTLTRRRMAHYGYTPSDIALAEQEAELMESGYTHRQLGCFFEGQRWVCMDEISDDGASNHPLGDLLVETAEFVGWVLDEVADDA